MPRGLDYALRRSDGAEEGPVKVGESGERTKKRKGRMRHRPGLDSSIVTDELFESAHKVTIIALEMKLPNRNIFSRYPTNSRFPPNRV